jgi:hypothetical protein
MTKTAPIWKGRCIVETRRAILHYRISLTCGISKSAISDAYRRRAAWWLKRNIQSPAALSYAPGGVTPPCVIPRSWLRYPMPLAPLALSHTPDCVIPRSWLGCPWPLALSHAAAGVIPRPWLRYPTPLVALSRAPGVIPRHLYRYPTSLDALPHVPGSIIPHPW